ncbi:uncharacterized protein SEPMUDRAFT_137642 [Sphaerulina musiva SO2202]|uniref:CREG-like beta-barrel domain-containing protein n=1 Tax=Sphaerulina musiva (strain SO2202) TaxID=692275 RepID=N1QKU0_SPHMS|nr:uncharacterized protein SEPMUDRAFT_137642 [Sphaerulina musiva SO2202]EMF16907.1 hypothetical protein SEPMUDRAFT_137642 [Sphaerulina musiva SO2202]
MKTASLLVATAALSAASSVGQITPQHVFANPDASSSDDFHFPTVRESVAQARKILHLTTVGDLVTVFPSTTSNKDVSASENRPEGMDGSPIGLMEYYADCDPHSGNPVLLALDIATPYKNYNHGSNISLSIRWWPIQKNTYSMLDTFTSWMWKTQDEDEIPTPHTPAALPRFSLHGHLETISAERLQDGKIQACFLRSHPDSIYWQPGNDIHQSHYAQLVVDHIYWFGGFGDRARIGWLPLEIWQNLTMQEVIEAKLPGEKKYNHKRSSNWW